MKALTEWSWPGNVRELENLMERSVILTSGNALHVPLSEMRTRTNVSLAEPDNSLDSAEREHIIRILRETGAGSPDRTARPNGLG